MIKHLGAYKIFELQRGCLFEGGISKGGACLFKWISGQEYNESQQIVKKEEREDKSCLQMKAKISLVVLAKYTTVTKDIKSEAVLVQKLEEKKKSLRYWKAKIGCC